MFLANWKELELGIMQNLDQLMDNINTLYEHLKSHELLFIKVSKLSLLGNNFIKNNPLYMLYGDIFKNEKFWDQMGIMYNNWKKGWEEKCRKYNWNSSQENQKKFNQWWCFY